MVLRMEDDKLENALRAFCLSNGFHAACVSKSCDVSSVELVCCLSFGHQAAEHRSLQITTSRRFSQLATEGGDIIWMNNIIVSEFPFKCVVGIPIQVVSGDSYALVLSSLSRIAETEYGRNSLREISSGLAQILRSSVLSPLVK